MSGIARDEEDVEVTIGGLFRARNAAEQVQPHRWFPITTGERGERLT